MQTARKAKRAGLYFCVIGGVIFAVVFLLKPLAENVRVVDDRFEVLACKLSTQSTHEMYDGNQLAGRLNGWVKGKWGVNVTKRGGLAGSGPAQAILLRYRGRIDLDSLNDLKAFLTNDEGQTVELPSMARYRGKDSFIKLFPLKAVPTNHGPFSVSFKLPNGEEMAVWKIERFESITNRMQ
jgi:hypothetical protein